MIYYFPCGASYQEIENPCHIELKCHESCDTPHCHYCLYPRETIKLQKQWISVKDKLPDIKHSVLVVDIEGDQFVAWIDSFGIENKPIWQYSYCCGCFCGSITHWMPLLAAPNRDKE